MEVFDSISDQVFRYGVRIPFAILFILWLIVLVWPKACVKLARVAMVVCLGLMAVNFYLTERPPDLRSDNPQHELGQSMLASNIGLGFDSVAHHEGGYAKGFGKGEWVTILAVAVLLAAILEFLKGNRPFID